MTGIFKPTLRQKLIARNGSRNVAAETLHIPSTGRIDAEIVSATHQLAIQAHAGDDRARDTLFFSLQPRLDCVSNTLKPWPNTPRAIGVWDRDDARQEAWLIFVDLLESWDGSVPFIPYLLSRFAWRLRDRIFRGIGKPQTQLGTTRVPEGRLAGIMRAGGGEQPDSIVIAQIFLEELVERYRQENLEAYDLDAWSRIMGLSEEKDLVSPSDELDTLLPDMLERTG